MPYVLFRSRFPEIAERETRSVTVFGQPVTGLPAGDYGFLEMFCDEPRCDCRRVFFYVVSPRRRDPVAVIAYGWENRRFYARWMGDGDPSWARELKGPVLNPSSPQSPIAPAVLTLFRKALLSDRAFMNRVKKHCRMFRAEIDGADRSTRHTKRASR